MISARSGDIVTEEQQLKEDLQMIRSGKLMEYFANQYYNSVNFGNRATSARTFSHTLTENQPHCHGGQPQG